MARRFGMKKNKHGLWNQADLGLIYWAGVLGKLLKIRVFFLLCKREIIMEVAPRVARDE